MQVEMAVRAKREMVVTDRMSEPVMNVVRLLHTTNNGTLVVADACGTDGDALLGSPSEPDALTAAADRHPSASSLPASAFMTSDDVTYPSYDMGDYALGLINGLQVRYIPVFQRVGLVGVSSMRDMLSLAYACPHASPVSNSNSLAEA